MGAITANLNIQTLQDPSPNLAEITPNDVTVFTQATTALHIGTGGALAVVDADGNSVILAPVDGQLLPIRVVQVLATGTTAADITGLFR